MRVDLLVVLLGAFDLPLDFANRRQVLLEFALVSWAETGLKLSCVIGYKIEDAASKPVALGAGFRCQSGIGTEEAFDYTRRLAKQGLFVGISSGANLAGALNVARRVQDAVVVVIFCDGGEKYLSERFWDDKG